MTSSNSPKAALGSKRSCPSCGAKFYDFNKDELTCPKCSHEFDIEEAAVEEVVEAEPETKGKKKNNGGSFDSIVPKALSQEDEAYNDDDGLAGAEPFEDEDEEEEDEEDIDNAKMNDDNFGGFDDPDADDEEEEDEEELG